MNIRKRIKAIEAELQEIKKDMFEDEIPYDYIMRLVKAIPLPVYYMIAGVNGKNYLTPEDKVDIVGMKENNMACQKMIEQIQAVIDKAKLSP
jgi:hypothetical protein